MPVRTYTGIDFHDFVTNFSENSGSDTAAATVFSPMHFTVTSGGSNTPFSDGMRNNVVYQFQASGFLDFDAFPSIPDNGLVSKIEARIDITLTATGSASSSPATSCVVDGILAASIFAGDTDLTNLQVSEIDNDTGSGSANGSLNFSDSYSRVHTLDFSGAPLTKAELVAQFGGWLVSLGGAWVADSDGSPGVTNATSENSGFSFSGIIIEVTYQDGPAVGFTISPSGGPVEQGQILVVTGPGASELEFLALREDEAAIPITPQIISEDEVWIEVPYPALGPCFDCFSSCPECDDAFAPCDEDLTGEACQEAMQACLDCLTGCLEDLQQAEQCQESSGILINTPTPIIIIAGGTQFTGSVTLGNFVILVADGSGLYHFSLDQFHDTIYSTARDGTTYNVKIPNPTGKTGFFRS